MPAGHRIWWWTKLVLAIAALAAIYWLIDPSKLRGAIETAHISYLAFALLLLIPNLWFQFLKWRSLLRLGYHDIGDGIVWRSLLSGFAFGIVTPARVGEFGGRLLPDQRLQNSSTMSLAAVDKLASMLVTLSFGGVGLAYWGYDFHWFGFTFALPIALTSLVVPVVAWSLLSRISTKSGAAHDTGNVFKRTIHKLRLGFGLVSLRNFWVLIGYSCAFYLTFIAQLALLLLAFENISVLYAVVGSACVMIAKTVIPPITLGELGIREGLSVFFMSMVGMKSESAIAASLLLFTINILTPAAIGGLVLLKSSLLPRYQE